MQEKLIYDEQELLGQISEGSEEAFRVIFQRYGGKLQSYLLKLSRSKETAEDIVHDVFLNIWKNREQLPRIEQFDSYLFRAARNASHRAFQRRAKEALVLAALQQPEATGGDLEGEARITHREVQEYIQQAINRLTPQQRKVFLLSREEGLSHAEIAKRMGIARRTVTNTITEALHALREDIGPAYGSLAVAIFVLHGLA
ncbi:MAG: RNA polymerase sigma-70 factor [Chitinophagaceae bacterium]